MTVPRRVYAQIDGDIAHVATVDDRDEATALVRRLRKKFRGRDCRFWAAKRGGPRVTTSWATLLATLRARMAQREPVRRSTGPVRTDSEEDRVLAAGGVVRRIKWTPA